jgi:hypothetical protein
MTHDEATAHCAELNRDEEAERHWFVRATGPDEWEAISVSGAGMGRPAGLKAGVESRPEPSQPPDPRPSLIRNIPPYGAG